MIHDVLNQSAREMNLVLSEKDIESFELLACELKKWNSRINLTAISRDNEIAIKHFIDSLQLASFISDEEHMLDIGSGAGFPIIPLKIIKPDTPMISVDAVVKKINFQRHMIRVLKLRNIEAVHARVEDLHKVYPHKFSVITSRAFARLDNFVAVAAPLLERGGRLLAMKGADAVDEIVACKNALAGLGFTASVIHSYDLPNNMGKHCLVELMVCESA